MNYETIKKSQNKAYKSKYYTIKFITHTKNSSSFLISPCSYRTRTVPIRTFIPYLLQYESPVPELFYGME